MPIVSNAKETGKFDYDAPIEGLQAIDRHTIRLKLNFADYDLLSNLTTVATAAIAREVVEAYADGAGWVMANPVGTGPYRLKEWRRGQKIVLEANPTFRDELFPESTLPEDRAIVAKLRGKKLPFAGRIEISIIEESNPRLLAFEQRDLDYLTVPPDLVPNVLDSANQSEAATSPSRGSCSRAASSRRSRIRTSTWRTRSSAATRRTRSRCGARSAWRTTSTRRSACCAQGRRCRRRSRFRRTSPATTRSSTATPSSILPPPGRCSTSSATSTATRMAGAICRTASRSR